MIFSYKISCRRVLRPSLASRRHRIALVCVNISGKIPAARLTRMVLNCVHCSDRSGDSRLSDSIYTPQSDRLLGEARCLDAQRSAKTFRAKTSGRRCFYTLWSGVTILLLNDEPFSMLRFRY